VLLESAIIKPACKHVGKIEPRRKPFSHQKALLNCNGFLLKAKNEKAAYFETVFVFFNKKQAVLNNI